jgi:nucleoside-diphosphate-sugar epimerase
MSPETTIFLTGFPGFIAGRLVERLAAPGRRFRLLVQPHMAASAISKLEGIAAATGAPLENFSLIEGDITLPGLGLSPADAAAARAETNHLFHLAAVYDLAVDGETAFRVNLEGTRNVNAFAASLPRLERYSYVSTCYVAGKRLGLILENELQHDAGFRNCYEESKYLAEMEVERLKAELPVTIFRPSVVVGDSRTGETAKYDGIYFLIHYLRMAPRFLRLVNVGNDEVRLNLVPVDLVVDGITSLAFDPRSVGKTIALADPRPLTTSELFDVIAAHLAGKASAIAPPPSLVEGFLNLPVSPPLTGLPKAAVPYFFIAQTYDTSVASELLSNHGVECPDFRDYAANLLNFVEKHPNL